VIGGMLTATFLAIFMIPMFFVVIRAKFAGEKEDADTALAHYEEHHAHDHDDENGGAQGGTRGGNEGGNGGGSRDGNRGGDGDGPGKEGH